MTDLVTFLEALATDDDLREQYEADPIAFVMESDLSDADKSLLTTTDNADAINQAIADQTDTVTLEVAAAGQVKYIVIRR